MINIYKRVETISFILGTWSFSKVDWGSQLGFSRNTLEGILEKGLESGISQMDTAPIYGLNQVEQDIGSLKVSQRYQVGSKFGLSWGSPYSHKNIKIEFTSDSIISECEASLRRLNREQLSHYFLHYGPFGGLSTEHVESIANAILQLKESGKIAAFGIANCSLEDVHAIQSLCSVDAIQFECSAYKKWALSKFETLLAQSDREHWVYSPLARGLLSGKYHSKDQLDAEDHRLRLKWFKDQELNSVQQKLQTIAGLKIKYNCSYSSLFISWLQQRLPSAQVLLGVRSIDQLLSNCILVPLDKADYHRIDQLFD
ncbi:MAG: aldo/keto reductase [Fibrobacterales bacterium]